MYDYELEKSLEERQNENLELNLKRNKRNRAYSKKMKISYIIIAAIFVVSIIIGVTAVKSVEICLLIACLISLIIFLIVRRCPHCEESLFKSNSNISENYDFIEYIGTKRCPHCGIILYPSDSLTAIEERRKKEKSGGKSDSD